MIKKLLTACMFTLMTVYGYSQQAEKTASDTSAKKGSHRVKTVNSKFIRVDKPVQQEKPLPPMKTRYDTLMHLIQQHRQNKNSSK
jgi:transposase